MLKTLVPWNKASSRGLSTFKRFATAASKVREGQLRLSFDDQEYWRKFNSESFSLEESKEKGIFRGQNADGNFQTGLFQNPYLTSPVGLRKFSVKSLALAGDLVDEMRSNKTTQGYLQYIKKLDRLSDTLCRVIDLCEFIRASHPDSQFVKAAQQCHEEMYEFMNYLNTDKSLCEILKHVLGTEAIRNQLPAEDIKVGHILLEDFEKSGIDMSSEVGEQFISLSQEISLVGQDFINNTEYVRSNFIKIPCQKLEQSGVSGLLLQQLSKDLKGQNYKVPTYGFAAYSILRGCSDESIRMKIWTAMHSCSEKQIGRLTKLVQLRAMLAKIMGKNSFAQYQLEGKMAKNPKYVLGFIQSLVANTRPKAAEELTTIANLKAKHLSLPNPQTTSEILNTVRPWDRDFYNTLNSVRQQRKPLSDEKISSYFSLGTVMEGLSHLFHSIYGIKFVPVAAKTGETWSSDVRRINVVSDSEGLIGVVYCDLFEREGKTSSPAHFTVCCSRQIYEGETDLSNIQTGFSKESGTVFQLPVISLVCNFRPSTASKDGNLYLLQLSDVETLFHEMGHAMHSMLGRTPLQNISGTRCATDFVELPSILMEHFARDIRVLSRIGSHYETRDKVPEDLLTLCLSESSYLQNTETFSQAKMALLDQELHSQKILQNVLEVDVVALYHRLEKDLQVLVDDKSNWCGRFGHLFGYGSSYYSYLFDRAIASKVWEHMFAADPYSRASGEKFKDSVLKWGGLRDPWECIADALQLQELSKGDENAMRFIGEAKDL
ncbi:LAMI_0G05028g1_1 [Lachancea mirantina]|uniref:Mitochondrial intermediate peptidase n=1 Tax=Lachancea mirantina TaxID=1230905 RepID=A0A1G4K8P7_9SACH|nr:LAMI_0G05028g1_1 [Lachancea mirantina]